MKLKHIQIDEQVYAEGARYAKFCGFSVKKFVERAIQHAVETQAARQWIEEFHDKSEEASDDTI